MYRQFVRNLDFFISLNSHNPVNSYRLDLAKSIMGLSDVSKFYELKGSDPEAFHEVAHIVSVLEEYCEIYPSFKSFAWELWGYGFSGSKNPVKDPVRLDEQLKLIDLLLGTQYWH